MFYVRLGERQENLQGEPLALFLNFISQTSKLILFHCYLMIKSFGTINKCLKLLLADINIAAGNTACDESIQLRGIQEATGSNQDPDCHYANQASYCFLLFILVYLHRVA
jgi:hypothetical protein